MTDIASGASEIVYRGFGILYTEIISPSRAHRMTFSRNEESQRCGCKHLIIHRESQRENPRQRRVAFCALSFCSAFRVQRPFANYIRSISLSLSLLFESRQTDAAVEAVGCPSDDHRALVANLVLSASRRLCSAIYIHICVRERETFSSVYVIGNLSVCTS